MVGFHGVPHNLSHFSLPACSYSGCCSYVLIRTQSAMHSPSRLEASLRNSRGKLPHISYGAKSRPPTAFGKLHEQLLALVHLLSSCYAPACLSRMSPPKHYCYLLYNRCACSGCHSWLSFITVLIHAHPSLLPEHQVVQKSYLHSACRPCLLC